MNIVFAGTPAFAAYYLDALLDSRHSVIAVYTQPDRPAGRKKQLTPSPVKRLALEHGLPIQQPLNFKQAASVQQLASLKPDLMVVVAYGIILPQTILDVPRYGCINVHGSILPRWRGAAPIERAIESGDSETGVTIMQMNAGMDTGDILTIARCPIVSSDNAQSVFEKLQEIGTDALLQSLDQIEKGELNPQVQDETVASYTNKISKEELNLDWSESATQLERRIRAFNPWRKPFSFLGNERLTIQQSALVSQTVDSASNSDPEVVSPPLAPGTIVGVSGEGIDIACGDGVLRLLQLQLAGKKSMSVKEVLNGYRDRFPLNSRLGKQSEQTD